MTNSKRALIVDDHHLFLEGIKHIFSNLDEHFDLELTNTVEKALDNIDSGLHYHLILVDLMLPGLDGFAFLQALSERNVFTPSMVLSSSREISDIRKVFELGALGFLSKEATSEEMQHAVRRVLAGKIYLSNEMWEKMDNYPGNNSANSELYETDLGPRQQQVLELVKEGISNAKIATILKIEETTVKYHLSVMFKRFDVNNRTALVRKISK